MTGAQILELLNHGPNVVGRHPAGRHQVQVFYAIRDATSRPAALGLGRV